MSSERTCCEVKCCIKGFWPPEWCCANGFLLTLGLAYSSSERRRILSNRIANQISCICDVLMTLMSLDDRVAVYVYVYVLIISPHLSWVLGTKLNLHSSMNPNPHSLEYAASN